MDFSDKELKILLRALYRYRGEVSGVSQSEQNKLGDVESVIGRIEGKVGPLVADRTNFDREMEAGLAALKGGPAAKKAGPAKKAEPAAKAAPAKKAAPAAAGKGAAAKAKAVARKAK